MIQKYCDMYSVIIFKYKVRYFDNQKRKNVNHYFYMWKGITEYPNQRISGKGTQYFIYFLNENAENKRKFTDPEID